MGMEPANPAVRGTPARQQARETDGGLRPRVAERFSLTQATTHDDHVTHARADPRHDPRAHLIHRCEASWTLHFRRDALNGT